MHALKSAQPRKTVAGRRDIYAPALTKEGGALEPATACDAALVRAAGQGELPSCSPERRMPSYRREHGCKLRYRMRMNIAS